MARILSEETAGKVVERRKRPGRLRFLAHPLWPGLAMFIGAALGPSLLLGLLVYDTYLKGWQQLANPPGQPFQIASYDDENLNAAYIRTDADQVYACTSNRCSFVSEPERQGTTCTNSLFATPEPSGEVVVQKQFCYDVQDGWGQANVIILDDGTIWHWNHTETEFDTYILFMLFMLTCFIISPILGLIFGLFATLMSKIYKAW
jgi:hypothetical protein